MLITCFSEYLTIKVKENIFQTTRKEILSISIKFLVSSFAWAGIQFFGPCKNDYVYQHFLWVLYMRLTVSINKTVDFLIISGGIGVN